MKRKIFLSVALVLVMALLPMAFAQNIPASTAGDAAIIADAAETLPDNPTTTEETIAVVDKTNEKEETLHPVPTTPEYPINDDDLAHLAYFDVVKEDVEAYVNTAPNMRLVEMPGIVTYVNKNEMRIDTGFTTFSFVCVEDFPYTLGETLSVWLAIANN